VKINIGIRQVRSASASVIALLLFVAACASPPPETGSTFYRALYKKTGYFLGEDTSSVGSGSCAVESRYGSKKSGPVSEMVCVNRQAGVEGRVKYRVNYTAPDAGHRIWKIAATFPEKKAKDLAFITDLEEKFGTPRKTESPLSLSWQVESAYLEVREDRYGVHLQLWDRSLRE